MTSLLGLWRGLRTGTSETEPMASNLQEQTTKSGGVAQHHEESLLGRALSTKCLSTQTPQKARESQRLYLDNLKLWDCLALVRSDVSLSCQSAINLIFSLSNNDYLRAFPDALQYIHSHFSNGTIRYSSCEEAAAEDMRLRQENIRLHAAVWVLRDNPALQPDSALAAIFRLDDEKFKNKFPFEYESGSLGNLRTNPDPLGTPDCKQRGKKSKERLSPTNQEQVSPCESSSRRCRSVSVKRQKKIGSAVQASCRSSTSRRSTSMWGREDFTSNRTPPVAGWEQSHLTPDPPLTITHSLRSRFKDSAVGKGQCAVSKAKHGLGRKVNSHRSPRSPSASGRIEGQDGEEEDDEIEPGKFATKARDELQQCTAKLGLEVREVVNSGRTGRTLRPLSSVREESTLDITDLTGICLDKLNFNTTKEASVDQEQPSHDPKRYFCPITPHNSEDLTKRLPPRHHSPDYSVDRIEVLEPPAKKYVPKYLLSAAKLNPAAPLNQSSNNSSSNQRHSAGSSRLDRFDQKEVRTPLPPIKQDSNISKLLPRSELPPMRPHLTPMRSELSPMRSPLTPLRSELSPMRSVTPIRTSESQPMRAVLSHVTTHNLERQKFKHDTNCRAKIRPFKKRQHLTTIPKNVRFIEEEKEEVLTRTVSELKVEASLSGQVDPGNPRIVLHNHPAVPTLGKKFPVSECPTPADFIDRLSRVNQADLRDGTRQQPFSEFPTRRLVPEFPVLADTDTPRAHRNMTGWQPPHVSGEHPTPSSAFKEVAAEPHDEIVTPETEKNEFKPGKIANRYRVPSFQNIRSKETRKFILSQILKRQDQGSHGNRSPNSMSKSFTLSSRASTLVPRMKSPRLDAASGDGEAEVSVGRLKGCPRQETTRTNARKLLRQMPLTRMSLPLDKMLQRNDAKERWRPDGRFTDSLECKDEPAGPQAAPLVQEPVPATPRGPGKARAVPLSVGPQSQITLKSVSMRSSMSSQTHVSKYSSNRSSAPISNISSEPSLRSSHQGDTARSKSNRYNPGFIFG